MWPRGRLNRSEPSIDDEWGHSVKVMVIYENDYVKKKKKFISKQDHVVSYIVPKGLAYKPRQHWIAIVTIHLPTLKWHKWILTFKLKTMLLREAWLEEFQQCIIRKHNESYFMKYIW